MAASKLYNLARMSTSTTGTGTITLGSAVSGFLSFASAGVQDGETVTYAIKDGSNSEIGRGVYTSSGTTLTRSVLKSTNSDAAINLSGAADVFITAAAEDFSDLVEAPNTGATDASTAIQAAIDLAAANGGGRVKIGPGTFLIGAGLEITDDGIELIGSGIGATTLVLDDNVDEPVVKFTSVGGGLLQGMTIDGNSANQTTAGDGIQIDSCSNVQIDRFLIRDTYRHGISLTGSAALRRNKILNGFIEDTGAHGIYINDDDTYTKHANIVSNVMAERPGRNTSLTAQACFYISGWTMLSNCNAREFDDGASGTIGFHFAEGDDSPSIGANQTTVSNCHAYNPDYATDTYGFRVDARHIKLLGCFTSECYVGYAFYQQDASVIGCHAHRGRNGFQTYASTGYDTDGDKIMFSGCASVLQSTGVTDGVGFQIAGDRNMLVGCLARNKNYGYSIASGATDTTISASAVLDSTTGAVADSGTNSKIRSVSGYVTEGESQSVTFAVDSTGTKEISIAHGLAATPTQSDVQLTLARNTNVDDYEVAWLRVKGNPDATNVYVQARVTAASATVGATAAILMRVQAK